jgi:hypothetical protein
MIHLADLREWRDHDVVDQDGHTIGVLEAVYLDTGSDRPAAGTVRTGLPTRHRLVFVPVGGATAGPGCIRVPYTKALVKSAPSIGTDGVLPAEDEEMVFRHYGMPYTPGADGVRRLARR